MNFLKKLFSSSSPQPQRNDFTFTIKCKRCGEEIQGRIDLVNDLSVEYEDDNEIYYSRSEERRENRCFQRIEVHFKFLANKTLIDKDIFGGEFID
ncbi:MAG TPA: hypothetical protein DIW23_13170 [Anaerolineae bacterium]|nr:hypothetical protein [Anaerolineae bacterium]